MPLPDSAQKAAIRAQYNAHMPDSVSLYTVTETQTNRGVTRTAVLRAITTGRYVELQGRELERARKLSAEATGVLHVPAGTVVNVSDEIRVTIADTGEVVTVQAVYRVRRSVEFQRTVYVKNYAAS